MGLRPDVLIDRAYPFHFTALQMWKKSKSIKFYVAYTKRKVYSNRFPLCAFTHAGEKFYNVRSYVLYKIGGGQAGKVSVTVNVNNMNLIITVASGQLV